MSPSDRGSAMGGTGGLSPPPPSIPVRQEI